MPSKDSSKYFDDFDDPWFDSSQATPSDTAFDDDFDAIENPKPADEPSIEGSHQAQSPSRVAQTLQSVPDSVASYDNTIAEADVYMSYGLFDQAKELIKLSLQNLPDKPEYHLKLIESYYGEKNIDELINAATTAHHTIATSSPEVWKRIASLGYQLAP